MNVAPPPPIVYEIPKPVPAQPASVYRVTIDATVPELPNLARRVRYRRIGQRRQRRQWN